TLGTGSFTGTGADFAATPGCPPTLTPGAACEFQIGETLQVDSCAAGTYHRPSSMNTIEIPISMSFVGGVEVRLSGPGAGRIVSSPPGIDCHRDPASPGQEGRCTHAFGVPVALTAVPDAGHHFNGWSDLRCLHDETCTVSPVVFRINGPQTSSAEATFASPGAKQIEVTFAGSGKGGVTGAITCGSSCTGWIEAGEQGTLVAGSPSRFVGWSGACTGTAPRCDLGLVVNDRATTATFAMDDREQTTLYPPLSWQIIRGRLTPDGELIVYTFDGHQMAISRLSLTGDVRRSTKVEVAGPIALEVAPTGEIYAYGTDRASTHGTLIKLDAAGGVAWQRELPMSLDSAHNFLAIVPSGGVVAAFAMSTGAEARSYAADGSLAWSATSPLFWPLAVAVDPAGITAIVSSSSSGEMVRFSATGAPLLPNWTLPSGFRPERGSMAYDSQGFLVALVQGRPTFNESTVHKIIRLDPAGNTVFSQQIIDPVPLPALPSPPNGGLAMLPNATAFSWISHQYSGSHGTGYYAGALLETYDPAGTRTWVLDKGARPGSLVLLEGVVVRDVSCAPGRCAVFGSYTLGENSLVPNVARPWIEVFTMP
ncbi:MAG TPA: hypothetical protein VN253_10220, partial [Kofleriaceae bacterium]|nr:hypothetical protein [Kofleriaceae bacterium]